MKRKKTRRTISILYLLGIFQLASGLFLADSAGAALQLDELTPRNGSVGTQVTLTGTGFDPEKSYQVRINETLCQGISVTASAISFTIPAGAQSGSVSVSEDGASPLTYLFPFTVTRVIQGTWQVPQGVTTAGYTVGSVYAETVPGAEAVFDVTVGDTGLTVVAASRADEDPVFLAIITSSDDSLILDAVSTAKALIFFSPYVATHDESLAQSILSAIGGLSETSSLASLIQTRSEDGIDYLDDPEVESVLVSAIEAYLRNPGQSPMAFRSPQDFESSPKGTAFKYVNPTHFSFDRQFTGAIQSPTDDSPDMYTFKLSALEGNPLEWGTYLYRLNPKQFPKGLDSIKENMMDWAYPLERWDERSVGTTYLHSKLRARKLDVLGLVAGYVAKWLVKTDEGILNIPVNRPGVYMARSFSGNVVNGTIFVEPGILWTGPRQERFIDELSGGREQWQWGLGINITVMALDLVNIVLPLESIITPSEITKLCYSVFHEAMKSSAAAYRPGEPVQKAVWQEILKAATKVVAKKIIKETVKSPIKAMGKVLLKSLDVTGKVSKSLQIVERSDGLFGTGRVLAVDSAVIVIGHPFEPVIRTFSPRRGYNGSMVRIEGYNFDPRKDEDTGKYKTRVKFGSQSTDPDAPPEFEADVIHATENSLLVKVPDGARTSSIWVYTDAGRTSTSILGRPYSTFEVIDPFTYVTLSVEPDPVLQEGVMTIVGSNFPAGAGFLTPMNSSDGGTAPIAERGAPYEGPKVIFDEDETNEVEIQNMTETEIVVRAPPGLGMHTVRVRLGNSLTKAAYFEVGNRVALSGKIAGATIYVTSLSDEDDSENPTITLREAILIASGIRAPRMHDDCEFLDKGEPGYCVWQPREVDQISGSLYGAGYGNHITLGSALKQQEAPTLVLTAPLPAPGSGDSLSLGTNDGTDLVVDGSGNVNAWPLDGLSYTSLSNVTFRNFSGHGIYLAGGARGNRTGNVRIENCGGTGVFFHQSATNNILVNTKVTGAGAHGLHMAGDGVKYNEVKTTTYARSSFSNNAQYGVLIEGGASRNLVCPGRVAGNPLEGVMVRGENTGFNVIGQNSLIVPPRSEAYDNGWSNGGSGIYLGSGVKHTLIRYFHVAGNAGDGILLEGPGCSYNQIQSVSTGLDFSTMQTPALSPNGGNGIHLKNGAQHNLIGGRLGGMFGWRNVIGGNNANGILIDGAESGYNTINQSHIGSIEPAAYMQNPFYPNGQNGIVLRGGTHHNIIGDRHKWLDNHIVAHGDGAGILIKGAGTDNNLIVGNQIGVEHTYQLDDPPEIAALRSNRIGIHLKDGPRGNVIGQVGDPIPTFQYYEDPGQPPAFTSMAYYEGFFGFFSGNAISNNTEAGIVLENCGGELGLQGDLVGANIIMNNYIGSTEPDDLGGFIGDVYESPNESGIKLIGAAQGNIIGGPLDGQGNQILYNHLAGIEIFGYQVSDSTVATRISNNVIKESGWANRQQDESWKDSHLEKYEFGIGVLVHGESSNAVIGSDLSETNVISNNYVGVYIDSSTGIVVQNNLIHENIIAGLVVRDSSGCAIGGEDPSQGSFIWGNGSGGPFEGGIVFSGGHSNKVYANAVGFDEKARAGKGNNGWGIVIKDSSGNVIGNPGYWGGNEVVDNSNGGILLTGTNSLNNKIQGNYVGLDRRRRADVDLWNNGPGIQLVMGAAGNLIGGEGQVILPGPGGEGTRERGAGTILRFPAPNRIETNTGPGVLVDGSGSLRNTILYNIITGNAGKGIELGSGGNAEIEPPTIQGYNGFHAHGKVNLADAPAGSTVQVFSDPAVQGAQYLGEATVLGDGTWSTPVANAVFATITATVTDLLGNTSEFGGFSFAGGGLHVAQADSGSEWKTTGIRSGQGVVVLDLILTPVNTDVVVRQIEFKAEGSLDAFTQILAARLYYDRDNSGTVTPWDDLLGAVEGQPFDPDNSSFVFRLDNGFLMKDSPARWLLVMDFADDTPIGVSFRITIFSAADIAAESLYPYATVVPGGVFPLLSDQYVTRFTLGDLILILKTLCGLSPEGIERIPDPKGDQRIGLAEAIGILQEISELRE